MEVLGTVLVLLSVIVITTQRKINATAGSAADRAGAGAAARPDTQPQPSGIVPGILVLPARARSGLLALVALLIVGLTNIIGGRALCGLVLSFHACGGPNP